MKKHLSMISILFCFIILNVGNVVAQSQRVGSGIGGDGGGPKQSWSDIYKNPNLKPNFPQYDIEKRMISYNNLCLLGERIRTKYKHVIKGDSLFKLDFEYLVTDRIRTETVCRTEVHETCVAWEQETYEIPTHIEVPVLKIKDTPAGHQWVESFKKEFQLQECMEF